MNRMISKSLLVATAVAAIVLVGGNLYAESFTPVTVTGFNMDPVWGPDGGDGGGFCEEPGNTLQFKDPNYPHRAAFYAASSRSTFGFELPGGLPTGDFTSNANSTNTYQLAYAGGVDRSNNVLQMWGVDSGNANTGMLTLATPGSYTSIGILANSICDSYGNIGSYAFDCTLHFSDNSVQNATFAAPDWVSGSGDVAFEGPQGQNGPSRIYANNLYSLQNSTTVHLFESTIAVDAENQSKLLTGITFEGYVGSAEVSTLVFAVSGAAVPEPGTLALIATGLIGLICYAWRKRR